MTSLVQILLPLADNDGKPFPDETLRAIETELSSRFGGLTAFTRAPAKGVWTQGQNKAEDDIVVVEVMVDNVDAAWWTAFRQRLERELRQDSVIIRAQDIRLL